MKKPMQGYTVVGYYEDSSQIWVEHVNGHDSNEAVVKAVKKLEKNAECQGLAMFSKTFRQNLNIVEIFCGTHKGQTDGNYVSSAIDWPGLEVE
jgi:hypothetical protein